jgi:phosphoribosyl 1,2-cyclic phosphate phosphodiesterase
MRLTVLGSGTSHGVPVVACACATCRSPDPRDRRWRSSALVEAGSTAILVDAGPEFRLQALRAGIRRLDAVVMTHAHADHAHGLDDLRPICGARMPVHANAQALAELRSRFSYAFEPQRHGGGLPRFELLEATGTFCVGEIACTPIPVLHGELPVLGWRFDAPSSAPIGYVTDASEASPGAIEAFRGVDALVVGGIRARPHPTHFNFEEAAGFAEECGARRAWFTHLTHDFTHEAICAWCRDRASRVALAPAYDGLVIEA